MYDGVAQGQSKAFPVHVIVPDTAFSTPDFKNNGTGWQPGDGKDQSFNTSNVDGSGAIKGYYYDNNDWSAALVYRDIEGGLGAYYKGLYRPWNSKQTIWEAGNKVYGPGVKDTWVDQLNSNGTQSVAEGTELHARLNINTSKIDSPTRITLSDQWTKGELQPNGKVQVFSPSGEEITTGFTVQWSLTGSGKQVANADDSAGWVTSVQGIPNATAVRVIFEPGSLPVSSAAENGYYYAQIPLKVMEEYPDPLPVAIKDTMYGQIGTDIGGANIKQVVPVSTPIPNLGIEISSNPEQAIGVKDRDVEFEINTTVADLVSSTNPITGEVTISFDPCYVNLELLSPEWELVGDINPGSGCATDNPTNGTMTLRPKGNSYIPADGMKNGIVYMPPIKLGGQASDLASNAQLGISATWSMPKESEVLPVTDSTQLQTADSAQIYELLTGLTPKEEINDPLSWQVNVSAVKMSTTESGNTETLALKSDTIVVMPQNKDTGIGDQYKALLASDSGNDTYKGALNSNYHGTYSVTDITIDSKNSVPGTSFTCTLDQNPSLNPSEGNYSAENCQGDNLAKVTAIKVSQPGGDKQGKSRLNITIQPQNNHSKDTYLMWIGPVIAIGAEKTMAWPVEQEVVASTVSGYIYWDESGVGTNYNPDFPGIENVNVNIYDKDDKLVKGPIQTDEDGYYKFEELHSGEYTIKIDGTPEKRESKIYVGRQLDVEQTYSYLNQRMNNAKPESTPFKLGKEQDLTGINFGFFAPDPYSDLAKSVSSASCDQETNVCDLSWEIDVTNGSPLILPGEVVQVDTSIRASYALTKNGDVYAWGTNPFGQLGLGLPGNAVVSTPTKIESLSGLGIVKLARTESQSMFAITSNGDVYGWGINNQKQLGLVDQTQVVNVPTLIPGLSNITDVSGSDRHTLYLDNKGNVFVSGTPDPYFGQLGLGATTSAPSPVKIPTLSNIKQITSGEKFNLALNNDGQVYAWGVNWWNNLGFDSPNQQYNANNVPYLSTPELIPGLSNIKQISAGYTYALAIDNNNKVYGWGKNDVGQVGIDPSSSINAVCRGSETDNNTAALVSRACIKTPTAINLNNITSVSAGQETSAALNDTGQLLTWGSNGGGNSSSASGSGVPVGALGNGTDGGYKWQPTVVANLNNVKQIDSFTAMVALQGDGTVVSWGNNTSKQLGIRTDVPSVNTPTPVIDTWTKESETIDYKNSIGGNVTLTGGKLFDKTSNQVYDVQAFIGQKITQVSAGNAHVIALTDNNDVYVWGANGFGQLGLGIDTGSGGSDSTNRRQVPTKLDFNFDGKIVQVMAFGSSTMALTDQGSIYSWGRNEFGQLGLGNTSQQNSPEKITAISNVAKIASGDTHALALTQDGKLYSWGGGTNGRLGLGNTDQKNSPVQVTSITSAGAIADISGRLGASYVIMKSGDVYAFGLNLGNKFGNLPASVLVPTQITGLPVIVSATGTSTSSMFLSSNGEVYVLGGSTENKGQTGLGNTDGVDTPTKIPGLSGIKEIQAGKYSAYALTSNGQLYSWGSNTYGQLGYESNDNVLKPEIVSGVSGITGFSVGSEYSSSRDYVITIASGLYSWGNNHYGQLGIGHEDYVTPEVIYDTPQKVISTWNDPKVTLPKISEGVDGDFIQREYELPNLAPNEKVTVIVTAKVNMAKEGFVIGNQAWETYNETPRDKPGVNPGLPAYDENDPYKANNWTGNTTCTATPNFVVPGDQCDQVFASIPATPKPLGNLSGIVWWDQNNNDTYENDDTLLNDVTVILYQKGAASDGSEDVRVGSMQTNSDGYYEFKDLLANKDYYVVFAPSGATNLPNTGKTDYVTNNNTCELNKSCSSNTGISSVVEVLSNETTENVNAGIYLSVDVPETIQPSLALNQECGKKPTLLLPSETDVKAAGFKMTSKDENDQYTVTFTPLPGYRLADGAKTEFTFEYTIEPCPINVTPVAPTLDTNVACDKPAKLVLPETHPGVEYEVTNLPTGFVVIATPTEGYEFAEGVQTIWTLEYEIIPCTEIETIAPALNPIVECGEKPTLVTANIEGLEYTINDTGSSYEVTASAKAGYKIKEGQTTSWTIDYTIDVCATPIEPTLNKEVDCEEEYTVTIPQDTKEIKYTSSREGDIITVVATAQDGYKFPANTTSTWTFNVHNPQTCPIEVEPLEPTITPSSECDNEPTLNLPNQPGIVYNVEKVDGKYIIDAIAENGYVITEGSTTHWELAIIIEKCPVVVEPEAPKIDSDVACDYEPTLILPSQMYAKYTVKKENGKYIVDATPLEGYVFKEGATTHWEFDIVVEKCPVVVGSPLPPPKLQPAVECNEVPKVITEEVEGVEWKVAHNKDKNSYSIKAVAKEGFVFAEGAQTEWTLTYTMIKCAITQEPTLDKNVECEKDYKVILPQNTEEVSYTSSKKGKIVTVKATANTGYSFAQDTQTEWTFDVSNNDKCPIVPGGTNPTKPLPETGSDLMILALSLLGITGLGAIGYKRVLNK